MAVAAHHLGLSASLGAFLAGLALSGAEWRHDVKNAVKPLESTFLGIFFLSLGAQVPLGASPTDMAFMVLAATGLIVMKAFAGFVAGMSNGLDKRTSIRIGLILAQAGEFSFVVFGAVSGVIPKTAVEFWAGAAVISLVATPMLVNMAAKLKAPGKDSEVALETVS
jgi:CPA2 family monovalent cation:H+ antiporter-2